MTEGINTFKGLAVPLSGESEIKQLNIAYDILTLSAYASNTSDYLVLQDSDGTEGLVVNYLGRIQQAVSYVVADTMKTALGSWASFYGGASFKMTVPDQTTGNVWLTGGIIGLDYAGDASATGANIHGATIGLQFNTTADNSGGSSSVLCLIYEQEAGAVQAADAGNAWLEFYNIDTTYPMPRLFELHVHASTGCFSTATNTTIDHALAITVNNTVYYIGLYDAKTT